MPSISIKYFCYVKSSRKNYISVTWKTIERIILSTRESIERNEIFVNENNK